MDPRIDWIDNRSTNTMPILGLCFLDSKEDKTSRGHFVMIKVGSRRFDNLLSFA